MKNEGIYMENNEIQNKNIQNDNMISTDTTSPVDTEENQVTEEASDKIEKTSEEQPTEKAVEWRQHQGGTEEHLEAVPCRH